MIAAVLAVWWRRPPIFLQVAIADLAGQLISYGLKQWIGRVRPNDVYASPKPLVHAPHDGSFPSGHATVSFACATVLAFYAPRAAPAFFVLAAAIAWSRVYVGVHYPLDVLGGAVLGVAIALALRFLARGRPEAGSAGREARRPGGPRAIALRWLSRALPRLRLGMPAG